MEDEKLNGAEETIPFAFKRKEVSDEQISRHWSAIQKRIKELEKEKKEEDEKGASQST